MNNISPDTPLHVFDAETLGRYQHAIQKGMPQAQALAGAQAYMKQKQAAQQQQDDQAASQPKPFRLTDLLPTAGGVLGGVAGSFLGPAGAIVGGGGGSALGEELRQALTGEVSGSDILKQTGLGLAGGVGGELLGAGTKAIGIGGKVAAEAGANAADNAATRAGSSFLKSVVNPRVAASPFGAAEEQALVKTASDLGLKGTSANMYKQIGSAYDHLSGQISSLLEPSTATIARKDLIGKITTSLADNPAVTVDKGSLTAVNKALGSISNNGDIAVQDLFKYKQQLGNTLKKAFANLDSPTAVLTPKQETALGAWKGIADAIGEAEPQVSHLTQLQSQLFDLAPGLKANIGKGGLGLGPLGKIPGSASISQAGKSAISGMLTRAGAPTSTGVRAGSTALAQLLARNSGPTSNGDVNNAGASLPGDSFLNGVDTGSGTTTSDSSAPLTLDNKKLALLMLTDLQSTGGKNLATITALGKLLAPGADEPVLTKAQQTSKDALTGAFAALDTAHRDLVAVGGARGSIGGQAAKIPLIGQYIDSSGTAYEKTRSDIASQLAKAVTGGARVNESVYLGFLHSLPELTDTPQQASYKLQLLQNQLLSKAKASGFDDLVQQYAPDSLGQTLASLSSGQ